MTRSFRSKHRPERPAEFLKKFLDDDIDVKEIKREDIKLPPQDICKRCYHRGWKGHENVKGKCLVKGCGCSEFVLDESYLLRNDNPTLVAFKQKYKLAGVIPRQYKYNTYKINDK